MKRSSHGWIVSFGLAAVLLTLSAPYREAAAQPTKVTIHIPSKTLSLMPFYFGIDKGFFPRELLDIQLVQMNPPTAIAALVAGQLDFSTTLGAATSAIMHGYPLRRIFYVQHDPAAVLVGRPEIKTIQGLNGNIIAVTAITDATGMAARMILRGNGIDLSRVTLLATQATENSYRAVTSGKVAATVLFPPFGEELEAQGYNRLADAKAYAPLSFIGLVASTDTLKRNSYNAEVLIAGLLKTLAYLHNPANRVETVRYVAAFHKIDISVADKAFTSILPSFSQDGTKPRQEIEKEIEIYRETFKIAKTFTPDDLEDMSLLKKIQDESAKQRRGSKS